MTVEKRNNSYFPEPPKSVIRSIQDKAPYGEQPNDPRKIFKEYQEVSEEFGIPIMRKPISGPITIFDRGIVEYPEFGISNTNTEDQF